ncbi:hypothetical protein M0Q97_08735 [Candidatus Dojkabacteria bacterium]|jgi:hypothetical protein|nr:hypothetical protein [Candidatus Dojkabacteria bacterium]
MIIKYNTARLAKEKGFDVPTLGYYIKSYTGWNLLFEDKKLGKYNLNECMGISAPEQCILQEWLFNQGFFIDIKYISQNEVQKGFYYSIYYTIIFDNEHILIYWLNKFNGKDLFSGFDTYEDCLEIALQWALFKIS